MLRLLRRLLHVHSPSLAALGRDPVVSRRWAERCGGTGMDPRRGEGWFVPALIVQALDGEAVDRG